MARLPVRSQVELADCGPASLAILLEHLGRWTSLTEVREACGGGRDGVTALRLIEVAASYGVDGRGVRTSADALRSLPQGAILFWEHNHFVVLEGSSKAGVVVVDPSVGRRTVPWDEVGDRYSGTALVFERGPDFEERRSATGVRRYLRPLSERRGVLGRVLSTSMLLRLLGLSLPALTAALLDRAIPFNDRDLLPVLGVIMGTSVILNFLTIWLRSRLLLELRTTVDLATTLQFLDHLVSLPVLFHQRREAGDLVMRLRSNTMIRETLTTGALSGVLDGVSAFVYLGLLFQASSGTAVLALGIAAVQVAVVLGTQRTFRRLTVESLRVEARTQAYGFQMLAGMHTLKATGTEDRAVAEYRNRFSDELRVAVRKGETTAVLEAAMTAIGLVGPLALLGYVLVQVLEGELAIGAALASNALAIGFLNPLTTLVGSGSAVLLLRGYIERLDDVYEATPEQDPAEVEPAPRISGDVQAEHVTFRYSSGSPPVLDDVSLHIEPGTFVGIVGRSGSGKTTLANVLVGLFPPTEGRVLYDGCDVAGLDLRTLRRQLGVVTQEPYLFATTIRENIAFTDPTLDDAAVEDAARRARIHDDIVAMPLGYETPLSEGGGSLSGGQRQRVALARALASKPKLLLLDEATSHLDAITEAAIQEEIERLGCTTIVVAHRLSTVVRADLILAVDGGKVVEAGTHRQLLRRGGLYAQLTAGQRDGDEPVRRRPIRVRPAQDHTGERRTPVRAGAPARRR